MVLYEGIFVGERQENEENENVLSVNFPVENCLSHSSSNSPISSLPPSLLVSSGDSQSEFDEPLSVIDDHSLCKSRVPTLKDLCFNFLSKNIYKFDNLNCLPMELIEVLFGIVHKNGLLSDKSMQLFYELRQLDLSPGALFTDRGLAAFSLKANTKLTRLNLSRCCRLTDFSIGLLAKYCPNLEELSLAKCIQLTTYSIEQIVSHCPNLQSLNLAGCSEMSEKVIDLLLRLDKLKRLNLSKCHLSDYTARCLILGPPPKKSALARLLSKHKEPSLTSLTNGQTKLCKNLEELVIRGCKGISSSSLQFMACACPNLRILDLSECEQLEDNNLIGLIPACPNLRSLALSDLPRITDNFLTWLANHFDPEKQKLRCIALLGNNQLTLQTIREVVEKHQKKLRIFGGNIKITVLRNKSYMKPFNLIVDQFITLNELATKVLDLVNTEEPNMKWALSELKFRRVGYRKNGTKRATNLYEPEHYSFMLRELLGHKRYFYLEQNKKERASLDPVLNANPNGMFLKIKKWSKKREEPEDVDDIVVPKTTLLGDLKLQLWAKYFPDVPPEKMLIVEEETTMKFNKLAEDDVDLASYDLISGDILHVEEITDWHYPSDMLQSSASEPSSPDNGDMMSDGDNVVISSSQRKKLVAHSHTQNYYLSKDIMIHVTETKDSYNYRKKWIDPNDFVNQQQINYIKLDVPVKGSHSFSYLKQCLSTECGLPIQHMKLYTRVTPNVLLEGDDKKLEDLLEGNTWLLVDFTPSHFYHHRFAEVDSSQ